MATPSIQTLITQAQQVLNLQSSNEIRATLAAVLANANVGTPLNPNLTTQQLWNEFGEIVRQSTDDIMSIITDQMMRMVFSPPAPGGAGADKQVIFNDGGVLAGDAGLTYNKATDALTVLGNLGVGINPAFKGHFYSLSGGNEVRLETAGTTAGTTNRLSFKSASGAADARTGALEWYDVGAFRGDIRLLKAGGIQIRNSSDNPTFNLNDAGNADLAIGNLAFASGKGIDFSANNPDPAGRTSELLNDYEEGTWTPTLTFATPGTLAVTYGVRTGNYTKVGNLVTARFKIEINPAGFVKGTASGGLKVTGLPFTASGTGTQYVDLAASLTDQTSGSLAICYPNSTDILFEQTQVTGTRVIRSAAGVDASNFAATNTGYISLGVVLTYTV